NGTNYANFNFQVGDGTVFSGDNTFTINVTPVNDPPTSGPNATTIPEDPSVPYTFSSSDFPFNDIDGDTLQTVKITQLPANGQLFYNGSPVTSLPVGGLDIPIANIAQLQFQPDPNENGTNYANFNFQVGDGTVFSGDNTFT
ncbi:Ig-like domain-containing protein, partial [Planktothrix paucivesiculata]